MSMYHNADTTASSVVHRWFSKHLNGYVAIKSFDFGVWKIPFIDRIDCTIMGSLIYLSSHNGTYILPKDGSYVRFISNNWYS